MADKERLSSLSLSLSFSQASKWTEEGVSLLSLSPFFSCSLTHEQSEEREKESLFSLFLLLSHTWAVGRERERVSLLPLLLSHVRADERESLFSLYVPRSLTSDRENRDSLLSLSLPLTLLLSHVKVDRRDRESLFSLSLYLYRSSLSHLYPSYM